MTIASKTVLGAFFTSVSLVPFAFRPALAETSASDVKRATRYYEFAAKAFRSGNYTKAKDTFDKALRILPAFPEAHIGKGQIALSEQRYEEALKEFESARDGYAEIGSALLDLRVMRYTQARSDITSLRDALAELDGPVGVKMSPSAKIMRVVQIESAIQSLEAIKLPVAEAAAEPPGEVFFYIGNALFHIDRADEAIVAWETCARRSQKFPLVFNNLAVAYWKKGMTDKARESLAKAEELGLEVNPNFKADLERAAASASSATHTARTLADPVPSVSGSP